MKLFEIRNPNSIWTNEPDEFESSGVEYYIDIVKINKITGIEQTVISEVKDLMKDIKKGDKIPLILLEKLSDDDYYYDASKYDYELHDGQHRFEAFRKLYPEYNKIKAAIFSKKK